MGPLSSSPRVGLALHADSEFLSVVGPLLGPSAGLLDYGELAPETLWRFDGQRLGPNRYHGEFLRLGAELGLPFVAHGVGASPGTVPLPQHAEEDAARCRVWRDQLHADHGQFEFLWCSDHLGATVLGGEHTVLPLPIPMAGPMGVAMADHVGRSMVSMFEFVFEHDRVGAVPTRRIGIENSAFYFVCASGSEHGDPMAEPAFLNRCVADPRLGLVLDLHNLHCAEQNFGVDGLVWLDALALDEVIEIHVAGGVVSDPVWSLPGGVRLRLDSHDHAVPQRVWDLLEVVLPRCPNLRGVTLERMEGTVRPADTGALAGELARVRHAIDSHWCSASVDFVGDDAEATVDHSTADVLRGCAEQQAAMATAMRAADPLRVWADRGQGPVDEAGLALSAMIVARLRFERILRGSDALLAAFESDPQPLVEQFRQYHRNEPPGLLDAPAEARAFLAWRSARK